MSGFLFGGFSGTDEKGAAYHVAFRRWGPQNTGSHSALGPESPEDRAGMTAVFSLEAEVTVSVSQASQ